MHYLLVSYNESSVVATAILDSDSRDLIDQQNFQQTGSLQMFPKVLSRPLVQQNKQEQKVQHSHWVTKVIHEASGQNVFIVMSNDDMKLKGAHRGTTYKDFELQVFLNELLAQVDG